jgi:hypothetical protein
MRSRGVKSIGGGNTIKVSSAKNDLGCVEIRTWYGDRTDGLGKFLCLGPRQAKALARWFAKYLKEVK